MSNLVLTLLDYLPFDVGTPFAILDHAVRDFVRWLRRTSQRTEPDCENGHGSLELDLFGRVSGDEGELGRHMSMAIDIETGLHVPCDEGDEMKEEETMNLVFAPEVPWNPMFYYPQESEFFTGELSSSTSSAHSEVSPQLTGICDEGSELRFIITEQPQSHKNNQDVKPETTDPVEDSAALEISAAGELSEESDSSQESDSEMEVLECAMAKVHKRVLFKLSDDGEGMASSFDSIRESYSSEAREQEDHKTQQSCTQGSHKELFCGEDTLGALHEDIDEIKSILLLLASQLQTTDRDEAEGAASIQEQMDFTTFLEDGRRNFERDGKGDIVIEQDGSLTEPVQKALRYMKIYDSMSDEMHALRVGLERLEITMQVMESEDEPSHH
ncbi:uncharacterized protein LOC116618355 [Nematostella vectensis]|uniref:uncharacterized protein LOC116618355 n=1 Tax=Nematostella vectensis TaxID=45351 RepID=UPI002077066B|nr:uncharacterized protein LOC116618355 [Nematostella vectensis]